MKKREVTGCNCYCSFSKGKHLNNIVSTVINNEYVLTLKLLQI